MGRQTDPGTVPPGVRAALTALAGHDGHVGDMCLAVLRSLALLAGLAVLVLVVGRPRRAAMVGPTALGRNPAPRLPPPRAPLLSSLCVLRL